MLGAILGDMIGSPYEFDTNNCKTTDFPLWSAATRFTDDTVMTCAVAQALMETIGESDDIIKKHLVQRMQDLGRQFPNAGYGGRFYHWLQESNPQPYHSWGNGSAMRVSAAGWLYPTMAQTLHAAELTASVTHDHPEGIKGAQAVAAAMFLARAGAPKLEIARFVTSHFGYDLRRTLDEIRPGYHMDVSCPGSVPVALRAFLEGKDFESTIRLAVSVGGDSDTIACIAGAVASCRYEIPDEMLRQGLARLNKSLQVICMSFLTSLRQNGRPPRESWQSLLDPPAERTLQQQIEAELTILHEFSDVSLPQNRAPVLHTIAEAAKQNCEVLSAFEMDKDTMIDFFGTDDMSVIAEAARDKRIQSVKKQVRLKLKRVRDADGRLWLPVYTSREEMDKGGRVSAVNRPLGTMAREVNQWKDTDGIIVNPFGHGVNLKRELLAKLPLLRPVSRMTALKGDITCLPVDAVVNAANESLMGGSGVDGAIHKAAGPELLEECKALRGCLTGEAAITTGCSLPARYIIHTVGSVYHSTTEGDAKLAACYRSSLNLAAEHGIRTIAFPCISTGVYGYPADVAMRIAASTVNGWLKAHPQYAIHVCFCCFDDKTCQAYTEELKQYEPEIIR